MYLTAKAVYKNTNLEEVSTTKWLIYIDRKKDHTTDHIKSEKHLSAPVIDILKCF